MNIEEVEGIGPAHGASLRAAGVLTTDHLLERGASESGRHALAEASGIGHGQILTWVNHADLMRIDGVGSEYADLLEAAGVDSPPELARRNPANLAQTFQELDAARPNTVRRVPSEATVSGWIEQARALPRVVTHGSGGAPAASEPAQAAPVAAAAPAPAATPAGAPSTPAPPRVAAAPSAAPAASQGIWARIKAMFGSR